MSCKRTLSNYKSFDKPLTVANGQVVITLESILSSISLRRVLLRVGISRGARKLAWTLCTIEKKIGNFS